jgi:hypothetical protein
VRGEKNRKLDEAIMPSAAAVMAFRELENFLEESAKTIQNPSMFAMQSPPGE